MLSEAAQAHCGFARCLSNVRIVWAMHYVHVARNVHAFVGFDERELLRAHVNTLALS